ncbi:MAG: flagellar motor protein MotD [Sedimenticola sp.]|uniref:Flagellar motor protein MotD n=1 Tax=Sedimenticola thiotaurini TaxID=1543721 RepID=A0A558D3H5_9GAMM|nr:flagellar motor protein MotD [Sedimenticola sp.]TVT55568.1 MAG: flagellar motor protein MotD [Sedimenticola thiotaurini]MCW8882523.1 flagellar motor protein MotD [Sedimenticola sp.]MCW8921266.1 flagellar motor protein MotD [Sedimenticola sp.]MCW8947282.1 flagellar motor protein MotD [Sedimenticola sp.]
MARRRRHHEEHENHERWLVSYADFITLLFAFFVVMYSISSVNNGKYRVLSSTLTEAFVSSARTLEPIQIGEEIRKIEPQIGDLAIIEPAQPDVLPGDPLEEASQGNSIVATKTLDAVKSDLATSLSEYTDQGLVNVTRTVRGIEVEMKSNMLFESGSARLSREALKALRKVILIVKPLPNLINVEGHTDNVPIKTISFPSNWELSAARSASVVHYFAKLGVDSSRMAAIGYGEHRPLSSNETLEGRKNNRRVNLLIMAQQLENKTNSSGESTPRGSP